ncbi:MBL fold metallo-hydrolase [Vibrio inusitatus NBRC 102082]|uniref:MBL fold metallo-hydrolase n=1 Tax=Vibrio inusitatus NBRC 102082 TaxID=1219070 RepID=A0A4Y3HT29_9VIBR|nr:MBL fold metallo-hydrolase [Vibrio inusitatus]GEA50121.1 MBL fold metallo-hydrolase [Vibrio inusitatus NBRC 102082]
MALQYQVVPVTPFQQNCSIVWCDETMKGVVIDPGGDVKQLLMMIEELKVQVEKLVLTHGHLDHVGGSVELARALNLTIVGPHKDDNFWLQGLEGQSQMFGFPLTEAFEPSQWLDEGDIVTFGEQSLNVIHTPGHTPGHVVLHSESASLAFVGDVLFKGAIGRTDFPKGDFNTLIDSIKSKLWPLGNETRFVPGHGPESTFGSERVSNPFVADEMPLY